MQIVNIPIFSNAKLYLGQAPGSSYVTQFLARAKTSTTKERDYNKLFGGYDYDYNYNNNDNWGQKKADSGRSDLYSDYGGLYDPDGEAKAAMEEIKALKGKVDVVVVLQPTEELSWSVPDMFDMYYDNNIRVLHYPIVDMGVPKNLASLDRLTSGILLLLSHKKNVLIHCYGGRGRTGLVAAAVLIKSKRASVKQAIAYIRRVRPGSIETPEQENFLFRYGELINDAETSRRH